MIELEQAWEMIFERAGVLGVEECYLAEAVGRALSDDLISSIDISPFRNSAMDGFAVKSSWLNECSPENPRTLPIGETVYAGDETVPDDASECAVKIMTGAPVPDQFDAVVKFEDTEYDDHRVQFYKAASPGENIRPKGEDISVGQKVFLKGQTIGLMDIGVIAGLGRAAVPVYRQPEVLVATTGSELTVPGQELGPGKIYNSNIYTVQALIRPLCHSIENISHVDDNLDALVKVLDNRHDVIVTTGGVSAGERDLVIEAAEACGWTTVFHKIRIKPGKPVYFAERGSQLLFGLPGNPLSTAVTCALFLIPALKKINGRADFRMAPEPVRLAEGAARKTGRRLIWPGFIREDSKGPVAEYSQKKSSAALSALLKTHGLIFQPDSSEGKDGLKAGFIPWQDILAGR